MVHVGLHSVGTCHKRFGWKNKKIKYALPSVKIRHSVNKALPSASLVALGIGFLKTLNKDFAECLSLGTRQRSLCRVPDTGHSAK
jgi:hypothetical protein